MNIKTILGDNKRRAIIAGILIAIIITIIVVSVVSNKIKKKKQNEKLEELEKQYGSRGGDFSGAVEEIKRAKLTAADRKYNPKADVDALYTAMHGGLKSCKAGSSTETTPVIGWFHGTCEEDIYAVLQDKTAGELKVLFDSYKYRKGTELKDEFLDELDETELKQVAVSLWAAINERGGSSSYSGVQVALTPRETGNPLADMLLAQSMALPNGYEDYYL